MELYEWQRECLAAWENNQYRGIANVITGAGKTYLAIAACEHQLNQHTNLRIRIVVPTVALMKQWRQALRDHADFILPGEEIGLFYSKQRTFCNRITIYCIGSARYTLARHIATDLRAEIPVLLIADECHHYGSRENRHIFDFISDTEAYPVSCFCLGLSATAFDTGNDRFLIRALGHCIFQYGFYEAVTDGVVSPFAVYQIAIKFTVKESGAYEDLSFQLSRLYHDAIAAYPLLSKVSHRRFFPLMKRYAEAAGKDSEDPCAGYLRLSYQRKELVTLAGARLECVFSLLRAISPATRVLIYCERIAQAEAIYDRLKTVFPGECGLYHSQMTTDTRERMIHSFREREIRLLISCRCLDEGIDVPDASVGIIVSGASVPRQRLQRLGRILRKSAGKSLALLYYIYVDQSAEDHAYLGEQEGFPIINARYDTADGTFLCPVYESITAGILAKKALSDEQRKEFIRCMEEGTLRGDFLLPAPLLKEKAHQTLDAHEKNYYLCMAAVRSASTDCDNGRSTSALLPLSH